MASWGSKYRKRTRITLNGPFKETIEIELRLSHWWPYLRGTDFP